MYIIVDVYIVLSLLEEEYKPREVAEGREERGREYRGEVVTEGVYLMVWIVVVLDM